MKKVLSISVIGLIIAVIAFINMFTQWLPSFIVPFILAFYGISAIYVLRE